MKRETLVLHRRGGIAIIYRVSANQSAVEFVINAYPTDPTDGQRDEVCGLPMWKLYPQGVERHSPTPSYEGQTPCQGCSVTGGECYPDGSSLMGESLFEEYWKHGDMDSIWTTLERRYREYFSESEEGRDA